MTSVPGWILTYMRRKISGGEFNGKVESGALARELHAVYVNSALNGVRTPQRALIGTADFFLQHPIKSTWCKRS